MASNAVQNTFRSASDRKCETTLSKTSLQNIALNTNKAGMEGLDTEKINQIIEKASRGSQFYQHKQKCQHKLNAKMAELKQTANGFTEEQISSATQQMNRLSESMERSRDLSHTIVHVDMDMFYAAVEMRDDPSLKDKPMAVGSEGMLSTSNYAARRFGVRAAMPGFIGRKLCPQLIIVPPNFDKYREASQGVQHVFAQYDAEYAQMSLDEAYLDLTDYLKENFSRYQDQAGIDGVSIAEVVVAEMREKICNETQLTASAGIAVNTRLAKVCSDINKPNGQFYLPPSLDSIKEFVSTLPIRKVPGIGNVTEQQLSALDVTLCQHLWLQRGLLHLLFSKLNQTFFMSICLGLGDTQPSAFVDQERKSVSVERSFSATCERAVLSRLTENLCQELAGEMGAKGIVRGGRVLTVKLKTADFVVRTRAHTLPQATGEASLMANVAKRLLWQEMDRCPGVKFRLLGVRMASLVFNDGEEGNMIPKQRKIMELLTNEKCGSTALKQDDSSLQCSSMQQTALLEHPMPGPFTNINMKDITTSKSAAQSELSLSRLQYECPVCFSQINCTNLRIFNIHVNACLNSFERSNNSFCSLEINSHSNNIDNNSKGSKVFRGFLKCNKNTNPNVTIDEVINRRFSDVADSCELASTLPFREAKLLTEDVTKVKASSIASTSGFPSPCMYPVVVEKIPPCPICQATFDRMSQLTCHVEVCLNETCDNDEPRKRKFLPIFMGKKKARTQRVIEEFFNK